MRALTTIAATVVCCLCADLVAGQQPTTQGPPVYRASTRLVHVAVVVTGRDGRAVEGLKPEDFEIKEAGKVHPVAHFAVEREPALGRASALSTTAALEALTLRLGGVTGRKNVIWVSSAFPLSFGQTSNYKSWTDEMRRATRALSHTDIAVYPVDAGGLAGAFTQAPAAAGTTLGTTGADYRAAADKAFSSLQSRSPSLDTMSVLAEQTGGRVYKNTNDLRAAMEGAVDDTRLTYVVGYYPLNEKWDGRFRPIDVKVNRSGVNVRHRSGYFAHPPLPLDEKYRQAGLQEAMAHPLEATGIGLAVQSAPGDGNRVMLTLRIDPQGLVLQREQDRWNGSVEMAIVQRTSDKRLTNTFRATVPLTLTDDVRNELLKQGLTLSRTIDLQPDARQVIVGVRDVTSGAIGTVILDGARVKKP